MMLTCKPLLTSQHAVSLMQATTGKPVSAEVSAAVDKDLRGLSKQKPKLPWKAVAAASSSSVGQQQQQQQQRPAGQQQLSRSARKKQKK
jgi:hypothetical protein